MRYCNNCERMVEPLKRFNWAVFILGLFFTLGIVSIIYLIYYLYKEGSCPMCNARHWGVPPKCKN